MTAAAPYVDDRRAGAPAQPAPKVISQIVKLRPPQHGNVPTNDEQPERRKQIASAFKAHGEVIVDFAAIRNAGRARSRKLLHQLRQLAETASPKDGAVAHLVNLSEQVSTLLERQLADWPSIQVIDREFAHSVRTRTTFSSAITVRLRGWQRDSYKESLIGLLAERDGEACVWCGKPLSADDRKATLDHVHLRSEGGCDHLDNLLLSCSNCNRRRGNTVADEFLSYCLRSPHHAVNEQAVRQAIERAQYLHRDGPPADVIPLNSLRRRLAARHELKRSSDGQP